MDYPEKLEELVRLFEGLPRADRIDLLLEYADALPVVPEALRVGGHGEPVHECVTPVAIYVAPADGSARIYVEVGEEAPTIAAVAAVLIEGCEGAPRAQIEAVPTDLPLRIIGPEMVGQRRLGLAGLVSRIRKAVARLDEAGA